MADNLNVTEGAGKVIASDDVGGVHYPKEKICFGDADSATMVSATNPLPVTNASLPLPTGAATAAKQPALGTAGSASSDVLTVQGIASMTALKVDGSAVTQPVSGTVAFSNTTIAVTNTGTFATQSACTNAGTFAVQDSQVVTDNAGFTDGTTKVFMAGYVYDEVAGTALTENDAAAARINVNRAVVSTIEDGSTRGRYATVSASNALKVDGSAVTQPVSGTVTANAGSGTMAVSLAAGATAIAKAEDVASADADVGVPAMAVRKATPANTSGTDGDYEMLQMSAGRLWVSAAVDTALPAGTNAIGKLASNTGVTIGAVEIAATQTLATVTTVGTVTTITNPVTSNLAPTTSGGCTMSSTLSSASSNTATSVKGSAGQLYGIYVSNTNASPRWLKFYNTASTPTAGSGTPVLRLLIPGNTSGVAGAFEFSNGVAFSSGIGFTITGAVADNDTTAISANEVIVNVLYK